ncbi:MAG TPA: AGE family epimerase/isomerase [Dehalococcoidia bacterium]|nr:AGE family epimerase/isomerase [Dehalococcoidia bacterium]
MYAGFGPYRAPSNPLPAGLLRPRPLSPLEDCRPALETVLTQNLASLWYPGAIDEERGGYRGDMDAASRWRDNPLRYVVSQSRTLWFFSALARSPYGDDRHLAAAAHGFRFLRERMWDSEHGGLFWSVDATSGEVVNASKSLCGQGFALYAICEYAFASKDPEAASFALEFFRHLEERYRDPEQAGYLEMFERDFGRVPLWNAHEGVDSHDKTLGTHMHLLEAYTSLYRLTADPDVRVRLEELFHIERDVAYLPRHKTYASEFRPDWTPVPRLFPQVSYGHDLESIWFLIEASEALGVPIQPDLVSYRAVFDSALGHAFDRRNGGFYLRGLTAGPALWRQKVRWVQAEALVAALRLFRLTNDPAYADCFVRTLDWVVTRQVDWRNGGWHWQIAPNGRASGDKAGAWRSCYHEGRAMLHCLELLAGRQK